VSSKRIAQVNELIREELGSIFTRELEMPKDCIVTISRVETSADLEHAKIWLKVYPTSHTREVMSTVINKSKEVQHILDKLLVLKFVPRLHFKVDESEDKAARINELIEQIHKDDG